jgi:hypothetical protein
MSPHSREDRVRNRFGATGLGVADIRGIGSRHALCGAQPALMVRGSPAQEVQFQIPIQPRARVGTVRKRQNGTSAGDQWLVAATRANSNDASGFEREAILPPAKRRSSGRTLSCAAAMRASLSLSLVAARCVAPATAGAKRL